ncbi:MAG TPA: HAMP domain-containing sensor histidine kinase [Acidimicrobiales bacterium]
MTAVPAFDDFLQDADDLPREVIRPVKDLAVLGVGLRRSLRRLTRLRSALRDPELETTGGAQLTVAALLVIPVWAALGVAALSINVSQSHPSRTSIIILSMLAGELALGAAVLSAIRAWVAHEVAPMLAAAGLAAYGLASLAEAANTSIGSGATGRWFNGGSLSLALGFLFLSVVSRREDDRPGLRRLTWVYPPVLALLGIGALSNENLLLAIAWAITGVTAIWAGRRDEERLKIWLGVTMLCLAQGSFAVSLLPAAGLAQLGGHVLRVVATTLVLLGTIRALQSSVADHQSLVLESLLAFQGSEARRQSEEQAHQEAVHNLRSALGAITVATHALVFSGTSASLSDGDRMQLSRALEASLDRARRLITREWASVPQSFQLLDLVMPAVVRERTAGVAIDLDLAPDLAVKGDRGRASEVLEAILDNARRYAGGSRLTIRAFADDPWVTLVIADRGPGIAVDCLERIFDRGWTTSCNGEGAGIGLHVARLLMDEQGGDLRAANRTGGGAVFTARFASAPSLTNTSLDGLADLGDSSLEETLISSAVVGVS